MNNRKTIVYVVDDDVSICRALSLLLKSHKFKVQVFMRAVDFLAFKRLKSPACLILDIRLPGINGLALQEVMKSRGISIPIIFITGHGDIPMSVKGIKAGAVDFLPKPFSKKKLLSAITQAIPKSIDQIKEQAEISKIKRRFVPCQP